MRILSIPATLLLFSIALFSQDASKAVDAYNLGLELQGKGDTVKALPAYDRAIALNPGMADAYNNRGNIKLANGDTVGALADYSKVVELSPTNPLSFYNRGNVYLDKGEYDRAIADYTA